MANSNDDNIAVVRRERDAEISCCALPYVCMAWCVKHKISVLSRTVLKMLKRKFFLFWIGAILYIANYC